MRILVIGATGALGQAVVGLLSKDHEIVHVANTHGDFRVGIRVNAVSPVWVVETHKTPRRAPDKGMSADQVATAYRESLEGNRNGEILDVRKFTRSTSAIPGKSSDAFTLERALLPRLGRGIFTQSHYNSDMDFKAERSGRGPMKRILIAIGLMLAFAISAQAAVQGRELTYRADDTELKGYLAYDESVEGKRPGILVVHEWWGLNDYARERARMLAELGYTALALDMYGGGKTADHPEEAGSFAGELRRNMPLAKERFLAALEQLKRQPTVDAGRIAAIGYCFGGGVVLEMARAGVNLDGVVSFHGNLTTDNPAKPGAVEAKVLVLNGAADNFTTAEQIERFKKEMEAAGVDYRFINYPDARHSFTNPQADEVRRKFGLPLAYDSEADRESWQAMQDFFNGIFRSGK